MWAGGLSKQSSMAITVDTVPPDLIEALHPFSVAKGFDSVCSYRTTVTLLLTILTQLFDC